MESAFKFILLMMLSTSTVIGFGLALADNGNMAKNMIAPPTPSMNINKNIMPTKIHIDIANGYENKTLLRSDLTGIHFTPDELKRIQMQYDKAPRVQISSRPVTIGYPPAPGERFDLLKYLPYVPKERNQGKCGNCWVWACTGAMEVDMAANWGLRDRLSIQWFNSNYHGGEGCGMACCGGSASDFANFYGSLPGQYPAVPWSNSNAYWQDGNVDYNECSNCNLGTSISPLDISTNPRYQIDSCQAQVVPTTGIGKEMAIANIKNVLKQNKPVVFEFCLSDPGWTELENFWDSQSESAVWSFEDWCGDLGKNPIGHYVLCVGYDDTDLQNRYWKMVNSWPISSTVDHPNRNRPNNILLVSMDMDYDCMYEPLQGEVAGSDETWKINVYKWWTLDLKGVAKLEEVEDYGECMDNCVSDCIDSSDEFPTGHKPTMKSCKRNCEWLCGNR